MDRFLAGMADELVKLGAEQTRTDTALRGGAIGAGAGAVGTLGLLAALAAKSAKPGHRLDAAKDMLVAPFRRDRGRDWLFDHGGWDDLATMLSRRLMGAGAVAGAGAGSAIGAIKGPRKDR